MLFSRDIKDICAIDDYLFVCLMFDFTFKHFILQCIFCHVMALKCLSMLHCSVEYISWSFEITENIREVWPKYRWWCRNRLVWPRTLRYCFYFPVCVWVRCCQKLLFFFNLLGLNRLIKSTFISFMRPKICCFFLFYFILFIYLFIYLFIIIIFFFFNQCNSLSVAFSMTWKIYRKCPWIATI